MHRPLLLASLALAALAGPNPAGAQFCPGASPWVFDDVLASDPFCGYITWAAKNGITEGCAIIDANHRLYCPAAQVSRSQMAAFVNRSFDMPNSTAAGIGTIDKPGGVFLHDFGAENTFLGLGAGNFTMTGGLNTGIGRAALSSTTSGVGNTAIGWNALASNTSGGSNTAAGSLSLASNTTGSFNTSVGEWSMALNTTGTANTALGGVVLQFNTTGEYNTALGYAALNNNTTGSYNVAVGNALLYNTTGIGNVAAGQYALFGNVSGNHQVAIGHSALRASTVGVANTAVGVNTLYSMTAGDANTAIGESAMIKHVTGGYNTAVGSAALFNLTSGVVNVALGDGAGYELVTGNLNVYLANVGTATESNTMRLGSANQGRTFVAGIRGVTTGLNNGVNVIVDSAGQLGTISSSREAKRDVTDMEDASAALMQLRPVTFHYNDDRDPAGPRLQYGLIAEEVADVYPGLVATKDGKPETIMYQYLAPMLLNEYQKQQRTIQAQAQEIAQLKRAVELLMARTAPEERIAAR